jgi:hypothetical protein
MKFNLIAAAVALAFATSVSAQSTTAPAAGGSRAGQHDMKKAEKERIEADYKADKAKCDGMKGNQKDVCMKEAKGKEDVAKAELDAKENPSERNQRKVEEEKAKAKYEVAKEKCDDMKGKEKDACEHQAKAEHDQAKASMKGASRGAGQPSGSSGRMGSAGAPATTSNTKP